MSTPRRPALLLAMDPDIARRLLTPHHRERLTRLTHTDPDLVADRLDHPTPEVAAALAEAELLLTSWGAPPLTAPVLEAAPRLRAVVHAAGSVRHHVTDACWQRGLEITTATEANAQPVAEYTLAVILLANKGVLHAAHHYRHLRAPHDWHRALEHHGNYQRTVGVIGASHIGRRLITLLRPHDLRVLLHDPHLSDEQTRQLGAEPADLDHLCAHSQVVTVHAPQLPSTHHMIGAHQLRLMPDGATLVNTSRGSLVDEQALLPHLRDGRLHAVLDVTEPEPPAPDSPLYDLPNVLLTPHVAGSLGNELHRLADHALSEIENHVHGRPFATPVDPAQLGRSA
ncbi:hydroxyacid dehydrogenase [Streptomyces sp. NPDC005438]|uniref:hydroxyacid dehydrogenase n=1 Tax=Streptomyces sp. NPDC005438 TaxID=3156880 RepID=UPI0033A0EE81